jgi:hypothetical protein
MSAAASALAPIECYCPACGAKAGEPCRVEGQAVTIFHAPRWSNPDGPAAPTAAGPRPVTESAAARFDKLRARVLAGRIGGGDLAALRRIDAELSGTHAAIRALRLKAEAIPCEF